MANDSPALNFKDVNLLGFLNNPTGAYLNRENELTQGVASTKVYAQMSIPSGTSINWFASNMAYHGVNLHNVWYRGTVEFRWFEGTLHAGKIKAYVQLVLAVAAKALNGRAASSRKRSSGA